MYEYVYAHIKIIILIFSGFSTVYVLCVYVYTILEVNVLHVNEIKRKCTFPNTPKKKYLLKKSKKYKKKFNFQ